MRTVGLASLRTYLEHKQVFIYFIAVLLAALGAWLLPHTETLELAINPALALMLFVTFLQLPLGALRRALTQLRFLAALLIANFLIVPLLLALFLPFFPADPLLQLGLLLVLLTPCIDYVVTFSHIGQANARQLLAATPILLFGQMLLLPLYLRVFLGSAAADFIQAGPFLHALLWLIVTPLALAALVQTWAKRHRTGAQFLERLAYLPVPATALVLFLVVVSVTPQLEAARHVALQVLPIYLVFAVVAPLLGWGVARLARLDAPAGRALAFSTATRNSLVILPLALAVPGAIPILPAVIVTQTWVELLSALVYMRVIPKLGQNQSRASCNKQR